MEFTLSLHNFPINFQDGAYFFLFQFLGKVLIEILIFKIDKY